MGTRKTHALAEERREVTGTPCYDEAKQPKWWKPLIFSQGSGAFRRRGTTPGWVQALAMVAPKRIFLGGRSFSSDIRTLVFNGLQPLTSGPRSFAAPVAPGFAPFCRAS